LVLALLLICMVAILVAELSYSSAIAAKVQRNESMLLQNIHAAWGGVAHARAMLLQDADEEDTFDGLNEDWAAPLDLSFGSCEVSVQIVDEASKINPNFLKPNRAKMATPEPNKLQRLAETVGFDDESLGQRVADWIDRDEEGAYEEDAANAPLSTVAQLLAIPGVVDPEARPEGLVSPSLAKVLAHLTVWTDGRVNINTASATVLQALLPDEAAGLASSILAYREANDFEKVSDIQKVPGFSQVAFGRFAQHVNTRSNVFRVEVTASQGTAVLRAFAIVERKKDEAAVLFWQERPSLAWD